MAAPSGTEHLGEGTQITSATDGGGGGLLNIWPTGTRKCIVRQLNAD